MRSIKLTSLSASKYGSLAPIETIIMLTIKMHSRLKNNNPILMCLSCSIGMVLCFKKLRKTKYVIIANRIEKYL